MKNIRLETQLAAGLPSVAVDRNRIQQVLVNVFMNALQAMGEGGALTVRSFARQITKTSHSEGLRHASMPRAEPLISYSACRLSITDGTEVASGLFQVLGQLRDGDRVRVR